MRTWETRGRAPDDEAEALERAGDLERGFELAHELKNPLAAVKALVQLGLRNPAERAAHARLAVLQEEVARVEEILQGYLSSPRPPPSPAAACVRLGPIVSDALSALSARAEGARVRLSSLGDACVQGDPRRLRGALLNLVANGIEATPPGGEVAVEVRTAAEQIEIVVRDTGLGMAPETLQRVGTPFFTTRAGGTGLGVALARSVIALHGGSVRYESAPGKGTTVRATLPGAGPGLRAAAAGRAAGGG